MFRLPRGARLSPQELVEQCGETATVFPDTAPFAGCEVQRVVAYLGNLATQRIQPLADFSGQSIPMIAPVLTYRVDDRFNVPSQLVLSGHDAAIPRMSLSLVSRSIGQSGWADNRRTAASDLVRSSVDAFSKSCGENGNRLKTMMRLAAHQNRTRMSC